MVLVELVNALVGGRQHGSFEVVRSKRSGGRLGRTDMLLETGRNFVQPPADALRPGLRAPA